MKLNQKRKGRMVLPMLEDKNLEENLRENDKKLMLNLDRSKRVRKTILKTFEIVKNTRESHVLKNSLTNFRSVEK